MKALLVAVLGLMNAVLVGCGPDYGRPVKVTGSATLDGTPLTNAGVRLHCMDGGLPADLRTLVGKVDAEGKFEFPKVYPQEYHVSFFTLHFDSTKKGPDGEPLILASADLGPLGAYRMEATELRARVSEDSTHFDFALKGPKSKKPR